MHRILPVGTLISALSDNNKDRVEGTIVGYRERDMYEGQPLECFFGYVYCIGMQERLQDNIGWPMDESYCYPAYGPVASQYNYGYWVRCEGVRLINGRRRTSRYAQCVICRRQMRKGHCKEHREE